MQCTALPAMSTLQLLTGYSAFNVQAQRNFVVSSWVEWCRYKQDLSPYTYNMHPELERNELFRLVNVDQLVQHEGQADFDGPRGIPHWSTGTTWGPGRLWRAWRNSSLVWRVSRSSDSAASACSSTSSRPTLPPRAPRPPIWFNNLQPHGWHNIDVVT